MRFGPYFGMLNAHFEDKNGAIVTEAYLDSGGVPTGPRGMIENPDGTPVRMGQTWTEEEALQLYADEKQDFADELWRMIDRKVRPLIKQHQFDGLGVLQWNIGSDQLSDSTALRLVNEGRFEEAAAAFLMWRRDRLIGGKNGPDGKPARDPQGNVMPVGMSWFKAFRGIYRRSISAALLFSGKNWRDAAAVNRIILKSYPIFRESRNEWYDQVTVEMDWKEILADAKDDPLPVIQGDPDPELSEIEPTKMERLQYESAKAVGANETLEEYVAMRRGLVKPMPVGKKPPSINTKQAEEVPYGIDPKKGGQPKEEAQRFVQAVKKEKGIEMKKMGERLAVAGTVAASANVASNEVRTFFEGLGQIGYTLLAVAIIGGAIWWGVGKIREKYHANKEVEAEINATQWMY